MMAEEAGGLRLALMPERLLLVHQNDRDGREAVVSPSATKFHAPQCPSRPRAFSHRVEG
jgi:hypothetical protein